MIDREADGSDSLEVSLVSFLVYASIRGDGVVRDWEGAIWLKPAPLVLASDASSLPLNRCGRQSH